MKLVVDRDLCEANAICMREAPEVFLVNESDELVILVDDPAPQLLPKVREAIRKCPRGALSLRDG
jgi:ferredoxin